MNTPFTPDPFTPDAWGFPGTPNNNTSSAIAYEDTDGGIFGHSNPPTPPNVQGSQGGGSLAGSAPTSHVTPHSIPAKVIDINYPDPNAKPEPRRKRRAAKNTEQQKERTKQPKTYDRYYSSHYDKPRIAETIDPLPIGSNPWEDFGNYQASQSGRAATIAAPPLTQDAAIAFNPGNSLSGVFAQQQTPVQVTQPVMSSARTPAEISAARAYFHARRQHLKLYEETVRANTAIVKQFIENHNGVAQQYDKTAGLLSATIADSLHSSMTNERQWLEEQLELGKKLVAQNREMQAVLAQRSAELREDLTLFGQQ